MQIQSSQASQHVYGKPKAKNLFSGPPCQNTKVNNMQPRLCYFQMHDTKDRSSIPYLLGQKRQETTLSELL